jgi:hypothetical protein
VAPTLLEWKSTYFVVPFRQTVNDQARAITLVELFTHMNMSPMGVAGTAAAVAGAARGADATTRAALTPIPTRVRTSRRWCCAITTSLVDVDPSGADQRSR